MARFDFDTKDFETSTTGDYDVMPVGEYTLKATDSEMKETKKGDGAYLAVTFEVLGPTHAGRKVWQNFNIHNPSEKAQRIGREQVAGWARAAGKPNATDSDELLERKFQAKLGIEKGTGGYSDKNIIKAFLAPAESSAPVPTRSAPTAEKAAPAAAAGKKPNPWEA